MFKTTVLWVALAGTTAASAWLWIQWRAEREINQQLLARVAAQAHQPAPAPRPAPVAASAPQAATPARTANLKLPAETAMPEPRPRLREDSRRLMASPEFRKAYRERQRLEVENTYRDLPGLLNLTPDQTERLFDLMADQGVKLLKLQWGWPASQQDGKSLQTMSAELRKQNDAELSQLLGERNLGELKEFRGSLESRGEVDALRAELARTSEPMREDQFDSMLAVVHAENQRADQELKARTGNDIPLAPGFISSSPASVELAIAANQRIVESAAMLLTPSQLSTVKDFYRRQRLQMETQRDLIRLQGEAMIRKPN